MIVAEAVTEENAYSTICQVINRKAKPVCRGRGGDYKASKKDRYVGLDKRYVMERFTVCYPNCSYILYTTKGAVSDEKRQGKS